MASLKDKVVLITGASSGIGTGCAHDLAGHGARLALHGRNEANLNKVAQECREKGLPQSHIFLVIADLTKDEELKTVIDKTVQHFGQLDVLVNNAGILENGSVETAGIEQYDRVMDINSRVVYYLTHLAVPHLKETKGRIVNISSVCGTRAFMGVAAYCISKTAVDQLTRCAALDLAQYGIRVNAVNPGVIVTDLHRHSGMGDEAYEKFLERCKSTHALGRVGNVTEVAKTITFLASDDSSYITGATIPVDGGRHAMCPR